MAKLKLLIGKQLKKIPVFYKIFIWVYETLMWIKNLLFRNYIRICEFFIPGSFYIQHTPKWIVQNSFPAFRKQNRVYSRKSRQVNKDGVRLLSAKLLLDLAADLEEGDYAELGTFRGNFARIIYNYKKNDSTLYCFDTFEGFSDKDVGIELSETNLETKSGHFSNTSLELVKKTIAGKSESDDLKLIKGYFPDTFKGLEDKRWRFVHLDADLYEPMKEGVRIFWPNIVKGGILLVHDYNGAYVGTKRAIDEYFKPLGITPIPLPDKVGSAVIIKN